MSTLPLMMFKIFLLQSWYSLSDPKLEKQNVQTAVDVGNHLIVAHEVTNM
ncbi:MAG: transposase [Methylococcales bacterium]|nr:transposase [Methylococcales bacterium]